MARHLEEYQLIERSITKKFRKQLWTRFTKAVKTYELINEGDKVAVCISGGKDSMLMAKLTQMLQRYSDIPFEVTYLVMDPGYSPENRAHIEKVAKRLNIPIQIFESNIFDVTYKTDHTPCYLCAKMRRGFLYAKAQELGCNKIALGHHFNDVIETTVMAMFHGSQLQGMMPKLHSTNFEGMELIRPMYFIREDDIISWMRYNNLAFIRCACRFADRNLNGGGNEGSGLKRLETKELIRELKKTNPNIETSIFNSIHSVCLDTFPGYKTGGEEHSFLEDY